MSEKSFDAPSTRRRDRDKPVRGSRGRKARQPANLEASAAGASVFDDRIIEGALPPFAEVKLPGTKNAAEPVENFFGVPPALDPTDAAAAAEVTDLPIAGRESWRRAAASGRTSRHSVSRPLLLLVAAGLLGGVFFVFQRGFFDTRQAEVITSPPPAPSIVAPVVVPPLPKPPVRRPATPATSASPPKKDVADATLRAPVVVPSAPTPPAEPPLPAVPAAPPASAVPAVSVLPAVPAAPVAPSAVASPPVPQTPPAVVTSGSVPAADAAAVKKTEEDGWFSLAEEYLQMGDDGRAEALYRRIIAEGTQKGRAALALGDLFARKNDFNRAQEFYRASKLLFQDKNQPTTSP